MRRQIIFLTLAVALVLPVVAEAQSHGRRCDTDATGYSYTITTPSGDSRQHDFDVYFNNDQSAFILLVFDDDVDTVLSTSSGLQSGDRFVHGSIRLFQEETYTVAVACVSADADYRLSVRRGEEISLSAPRRPGAHEGLSTEEAEISLGIEAVVIEEKRKLR